MLFFHLFSGSLFWVGGLCSLAWQLGYWVFWAGYRDKFGCIGLRVAIDQGAFSLRVPIAIVVYVGETPPMNTMDTYIHGFPTTCLYITSQL